MNLKKITSGMYLLETLTTGMYNDPLSIFREYVQNSVDSIDYAMIFDNNTSRDVRIELCPFNKTIVFADNGYGLPSDIAEPVLSSIGSSDKLNKNFRGFRGIGRLGGVAFSDRLTFRTKAKNSAIESVQVWDCISLRKHLSMPKSKGITLDQLFSNVTTFTQYKVDSLDDSYFIVTLEGVKSFRNHILDIKKISTYLSQVAPVPFNHKQFTYAKFINDKIKNSNDFYNITLNNEPIYKPYKDTVCVTKKGGNDSIIDIVPFNINIDSNSVAQGWYGKRKNLLGAISRGEEVSGLRVRSGNILIGDAHLLDGCFREHRFNSYFIGEIYVNTPGLIPNSRRDDFIDNDLKTKFYNAIEREIGFDLSKEIRLASRLSSTPKNGSKIVDDNSKICNKNDALNIPITKENDRFTDPIMIEKSTLEKLNKTCGECEKYDSVLSLFADVG